MITPLDDLLSASELNAAIDATNFPKIIQQNVTVSNNKINNNNGCSENGSSASTNGDGGSSSSSSSVNNCEKLKREYPKALKMSGINESSFDVPGTPRTPRTSTTPGIYHFV